MYFLHAMDSFSYTCEKMADHRPPGGVEAQWGLISFSFTLIFCNFVFEFRIKHNIKHVHYQLRLWTTHFRATLTSFSLLPKEESIMHYVGKHCRTYTAVTIYHETANRSFTFQNHHTHTKKNNLFAQFCPWMYTKDKLYTIKIH